MSERAGTAAALGRAGVVVTAANIAGNLIAYVLPLLGARFLAPDSLGALATAMALVAIATTPGVGLQTAVAVSVARGDEPANVGRVSAVTAALCGAAVLVATPVLAGALHLPLVVPPLLAAMAVPVVLAGRSLGELQGGRRFTGLAAGMAVLSATRYGGVIVGLAAGAGLVGSIALGVVTAWLAPFALAWIARTPHAAPRSGTLHARAVLTAASATLAMLVASYADLILARYVLAPDESGAYAVGAVLTRGAIWAPQVVTVLALPHLARGARRAFAGGLALIAGAGVVLVAVTAFAADFAVRLVGGADYRSLAGLAPYFAAAGALYAVIFFLLNAQIAAAARWPAGPLWIAIAGLVVAVVIVDPSTVGQVLACALVAAAATTVAMLVLRRPAAAA